jgi:hypothetical protein
MKKYLDRIDAFLGLFGRYVAAFERSVRLEEEDFERAKARDETQRLFFERQAEAAENLASTSHAQTAISKKTAEAIERSIPPRYDGG